MKNPQRASRARISSATRADRQASGKRRVARRVPPFPGSGIMLAVPPLPSLKAPALRQRSVTPLRPALSAKLRASTPAPALPVMSVVSLGAALPAANELVSANDVPRRWLAVIAGLVGVLLIAAGLGLGFLPGVQRKLASSRVVSSATAATLTSSSPRPVAAHQ